MNSNTKKNKESSDSIKAELNAILQLNVKRKSAFDKILKSTIDKSNIREKKVTTK